ncbi:MAG: hypothetical protein ACYC3H_01385 [Bellilinea sp.]
MTENFFVEVEKNGEKLIVHPSTVAAHKAAGWIVVKEGVPLKGKGPRESDSKDETADKPPEPPAK